MAETSVLFSEKNLTLCATDPTGVDHHNVVHSSRLLGLFPLATTRVTVYAGGTVEQPGVERVTLGVVSLVAAVTLATGLAVQISDQVINEAFKPEEYFSYFTIQTMLANLAALIATGLYRLQSSLDTVALNIVRQALFAYAVVTGLVYDVLLRGLPTEPGEYVSDIGFPNEILHVIIPAYIVVDWLITPHNSRLPWRSLGIGLIYPVAWVSFSLVRGDLTGWYPYDFLDPREPAGWAGVITHIVAIALMLTALLGLAMWINRLYCRLRGL